MTAPTAPRREELHETSIWDTDSNEITSRSQALRFDPRQAQAGKRRPTPELCLNMAHGKACWKEYPFAAKREGDPGCRGLLQGTMPFGVSFFMFVLKFVMI